MTVSSPASPGNSLSPHRQILGLPFFLGSVDEAVDRMERGGLLVVPAAPALKNLARDAEYREALLAADLILPDSAFMVTIWNRMQGDRIRRLSGLKYLSALLERPSMRAPHASFWIMAGQESARRNRNWLREQGVEIADEDFYVAPVYGRPVDDEVLLARIRRQRPKHIVVTVGGGTQERLGLYLRRRLDYPASIHCIGAAIAFLSGDQVRIPEWADRFYAGWLLRCASNPGRYLPRYWEARKLLPLMLRYGSRLPDMARELTPEKIG